MRIFLTGASGFIGTRLVERLRQLDGDIQILNLDLVRPKVDSHCAFWQKGDILERDMLKATVKKFQPNYLIHLAARTDPDGVQVSDYVVNTEGSANVLEAAKGSTVLERTIFISSQYVVRPGPLATSDREYRPYNIYGESKSVMEELLREERALPGIWTIVRPTNVWGLGIPVIRRSSGWL